MNWRPDDWANPYPYGSTGIRGDAYEVGAGTMLVALKDYADGKWIKLDTDKDGNIVVFLEADREV